MANYKDKIDDFVVGDDHDVERTINAWTIGQGVVKAWLTVKSKHTQTDAEAVFQKVITTTMDANQGQITDDGAISGTVVLLFVLTAANTVLLTPNTDYQYDVQVKKASGKVSTQFKGIINGKEQYTITTA